MWFPHMQKTSLREFGSILVLVFLGLSNCQSCLAISLRDEMFLTDSEREGFERFKVKALTVITTPYMKLDLVLMKYFRYYEMDEKKALELLIDNLKWRLEWGFESLTEDEISEHLRNFPFTGFRDKFGRGGFYIPSRYWDCTAASKSAVLSKKFLKFVYHILEEAYEKGVSNVTGRTASGMVYLGDLKDVQISKTFNGPCMAMVTEMAKNMELRWPGGSQAAYIVNADPLLAPTLNLIKNAIPPRIQKLLHLYDENDAIWMPELLKFIDAEKLPAELYVRSRAQPAVGGGGGPPMYMAGGMRMFPPPPPGVGGMAVPPPPEQGGGGVAKVKKPKKAKKPKKDGGDDDDDDAGLD